MCKFAEADYLFLKGIAVVVIQTLLKLERGHHLLIFAHILLNIQRKISKKRGEVVWDGGNINL